MACPTIDVVRVPRATDTEHIRALARWLDDAELSRAARYRADRDRDLFVTGRGALRAILAERLGIQPGEVDLGAPGGAGPGLGFAGEPFAFSVAHSGDWVVLALGPRSAIGVDVEELGQCRDLGRLVRRYFSESEKAAWRELDGELRTRGFYHAWTQKEAVLKGMGSALATDLMTITVEVDPRRPPRVLAGPDTHGAWHLTAIPLSGYACTLAVAGGPADVRVSIWAYGAAAAQFPSRHGRPSAPWPLGRERDSGGAMGVEVRPRP